MPNPTYDASAPTDPLRRWPAVIVPVLVKTVLEEADEMAASDRDEVTYGVNDPAGTRGCQVGERAGDPGIR